MIRMVKKGFQKYGVIVPIGNLKTFSECFRKSFAVHKLLFWFDDLNGSSHLIMDKLYDSRRNSITEKNS